MTGMITSTKSCSATGMILLVCIITYSWCQYLQDINSCYNRLYSSFLMHYHEAKLPVHLQMERAVSGNSLPQLLTEREHLKNVATLIGLQEQYRAKAAKNICRAQIKQKQQYDRKHNTNSTLKVGDKVLKSIAKNSHRMGGKLEKLWSGPYTIHKDLGKGRYSLQTLEGKQMKQVINCM